MKISQLVARLLGGSAGFRQAARDDSHDLVERGVVGTPYVVVQTVTNWVCTTYTSTITGLASATTSPGVPTPIVTVFPSPGTYTIPASTVTVTAPTTVCAAQTTSLAPGPNTVGGATTVVTGPTTITVPYASVVTTEGTVTTVIVSTVYTCPAAGTYTIGATTVTVPETTVYVYPTSTCYYPGTYTHPEETVTITETSDVYVCPYTTSTPSSVSATLYIGFSVYSIQY
ncbi:hypothetical protein F66182_15257 [Fusarium sp. NRRL 66182]|nr:hypothetical protein F66182_15257 [Fusarium sp. NRRL 66182]